MERARSQSLETSGTADKKAVRAEQQEQTLQQILSACAAIENAEAREIAAAARALMSCNQKDIRALCVAWHVTRKPEGQAERTVGELKAELQAKLAKRVGALQQLHTCMSASCFCHVSATKATLQYLQQISSKHTLLARVIDHACYSEESISHAIVNMLKDAEMQVRANLTGDQQKDACGFIASDAVQQLRQVAAADSNSWWSVILPDYSTVECISKGQRILQCDQRILDSDQVNQLVREYCNVPSDSQVNEEWWAGAIALDHFLQGLIETAKEMLSPTSRSQHGWKIWIVNTQSSRRSGSHWFTVAIGVQRPQKEQKPRSRSATQQPNEDVCHHAVAAESPTDNSQVAEIVEWARTNTHKPDVAKWMDAWREWEQVEDNCSNRQYRRFCSKHGIKRKKAAEESPQKEKAPFKKALRESLIKKALRESLNKQHRNQAQLHAYFGKAACTY